MRRFRCGVLGLGSAFGMDWADELIPDFFYLWS
jgi:hypothetical protein